MTQNHPLSTQCGSDWLESTYTYRNIDSYRTTSQVSALATPDRGFQYSYDNRGNIIAVYDGEYYTSYEYDNLDQLTRENNQREAKTYVYTYTDGNISSRTEYAYTISETLGTAVKTDTWTYGDSDWGDVLTAYNGTSTAVNNGRITALGGKSLTYSYLGLLATAGTTSYSYDTSGRRLSKTTGSTTTNYYYAGDMLVGEKTGSNKIEFLYDSNGDYYGFEYNDTAYYYIKNLQGDVVAIYNNSGSKVATYEYDAWGRLISSTDTSGINIGTINPIRYRSYYYDTETGFYYLKTRYYSPEICRFLSPDSVIDDSGVNTQNLFAYCANNPVLREDTGGQFWETALDVVSLTTSIVEVCINPTDPWAWAGLVGDTLDLVPFVTGAGELTRVVKATLKMVDNSSEVVSAARKLYNSADAAADIKRAVGAYEITFESGKKYIGKGGFNRAINSAVKKSSDYSDEITSIKWKSSKNVKEAFIDEYRMMQNAGFDTEDAAETLYNKIWSPGRKYFYDRLK